MHYIIIYYITTHPTLPLREEYAFAVVSLAPIAWRWRNVYAIAIVIAMYVIIINISIVIIIINIIIISLELTHPAFAGGLGYRYCCC